MIGTRKRLRSQSKTPQIVAAKRNRVLKSTANILKTEQLDTSNTEDPNWSPHQINKRPKVEQVKHELKPVIARTSSKLSAYEQKRLETIREKADFFNTLGIADIKASLFEMKKNPAKPKNKMVHGGAYKKPKSKPVVVTKRSLRLQNKDPVGNLLPDRPASPEVIIERHPRKPTGKIKMNIFDEDTELGKAFLDELNKIGNSATVKYQDTEQEMFVNSLSKMSLTENRIAKVVPDRIFSIDVHPSHEFTLVACGDKWGKIGFWQPGTDTESFIFEPHSRPVNYVKFPSWNGNKLYSCSYDGSVRCCDLKAGVFDELLRTPDDEETLIYTMDFMDQHSIIMSQSNGRVAVKDTRTPGLSPENEYPVIEGYKAVRALSVHPTKTNYFITGAHDGVVQLWDLRSMKKKSLLSLQHGKSINAAYFSPITGNKILTTCLDDKLRVYDSTELTDIKLTANMRHDNHVGRWLTGFRATWHPSRDDLFTVGSMARPRQMELINTNGKVVKSFMDFEYLGSVCSLNTFHPTRNILVGGNSSGKVYAFM